MKNYFSNCDNFSQHAHIESVLKIQSAEIEKNISQKVDISIVITTYNRPQLLREAIESAISQSSKIKYEILIVDNNFQEGKTESELVVESFKSERLRYFQNKENLGMFGNWNRGILLARGKFVTILHDDDFLKSNYLESMFELLKKSNGNKLLSCNIDIDDQRFESDSGKKSRFLKSVKKLILNKKRVTVKEISIKDYFYRNRHMGTLGVLFSRENAIKIGGFDAAEYPSADYFFFSKYVMEFGALHFYKNLAVYRIFENESMKNNVMQLWVVQGYKFRIFLINSQLTNSSWKRSLAKFLAVNEAFYFKKDWNGTYDEFALLKSIGLEGVLLNKYVNKLFRIFLKVRFFIRQDF
ncbi:glycosyltransferase family 2 protein [Janthinobacterium sp. TB1-E2]|uniref:Glycosyl transferase family 2 n=2 Tax=Janthinobacterium TaxID=29580 RepID=A0AB38CHX1_9BURK|nr:glycosyltransferase family 2 protein [Janthinobacterium lividum]SFY35756.1 Glycosyl transferase family 2 [Janthinobacterium lividum]